MQTTQDVIIGTLFIYGRAAHILFDKGAITFSASRFVNSLSIPWKVLDKSFLIATPVGKFLLTTRICKGCELKFESCTLKQT